MGYLKRHSMPSFWPVERKSNTWVVKPSPGPHELNSCMPLQIIAKNVIKIASSSREARSIIRSGKIMVDKKPRKDTGFPVGLMDLVEIPELNKFYRVFPSRETMELKEISKEDSDRKICRIENKKTSKGGLFQLSLHDGRNILTDKNDYKPGDSVMIKLPEQDIIEHLKMEKGAKCFIISGKNAGVEGKVLDIIKGKTMVEKSKAIVEADGKKIETIKDYIFIVDDGEAVKKEPKKKKSD